VQGHLVLLSYNLLPLLLLQEGSQQPVQLAGVEGDVGDAVCCCHHRHLVLHGHPQLRCPAQVYVGAGAQGGCTPRLAHSAEEPQHAAPAAATWVCAQHHPKHQICLLLL
jgi:hypothetical protein